MLKTDIDVNQIAQQVRDFLTKHIKIEQLIIYGSYAHGNPRKDSDIDVAIISDDFACMDVFQKISLLAQASVAIDSRLELLAFTSQEYKNPDKTSLLSEIKRSGKVLLLRSK